MASDLLVHSKMIVLEPHRYSIPGWESTVKAISLLRDAAMRGDDEIEAPLIKGFLISCGMTF